MTGFQTKASDTLNVQSETPRLLAAYPDVFKARTYHHLIVAIFLVPAFALFIFGFYWLDISWGRVWHGLGRLSQFAELMWPPTYGATDMPFNFWASLHDTGKLLLYIQSLAETLAIAFLGTMLAALAAFPMGFLAANNVVANFALHFVSRRFLDIVRTVDTLIWALIWINVVGLGPFAGILAIGTSNFGLFGKLFSEAMETADTKPVEGILSTGGSHLHAVRFGLVPQILPLIVSQILYQFESNTRSATIIGIVGAGGIGQHLYEQIKVLEWQHVSFLILLVLVAVIVIDFISAKIRFAMIGSAALQH